MNVAQLALDNIEQYGEYESLTFEGQTYTNVARDAHARRFATVLRANGIGPGDVVTVLMPNSPEVTSAFQAIWKIGAALSPITPMLTPREVEYMLSDSGAKAVITVPHLAQRVRDAAAACPKLEKLLVMGETKVEGADDIAINISGDIEAAEPFGEIVDRDPDDVAMVLYTSGTTGNPKGVLLTHRNWVSNTQSSVKNQPNRPFLRTMNVMPLSHAFGVMVMNVGLMTGSNSALLGWWDNKKVFETIQDFGVQRFAVVPTMLSYMLTYEDRDKYDTSSLELVGTGGSALPDGVRTEFEKVFNCTVKQGYGSSEATTVLTGYGEEDAYRTGSSGHAIEGVELRIVDLENNVLGANEPGEICARGPNIMKGYLNKPEATAEAIVDGWLHTGDIGHLDADGYLFITDRKKDLIIKGGENISPREIEEAIYSHSAVAEAAVVGIPDETWGEEICAVVVKRSGAEVTEGDILEHISHLVTKFKMPANVVFFPMLPKNTTGKIQKRRIRDMVVAEAAKAKG